MDLIKYILIFRLFLLGDYLFVFLIKIPANHNYDNKGVFKCNFHRLCKPLIDSVVAAKRIWLRRCGLLQPVAGKLIFPLNEENDTKHLLVCPL